MSPAALELGLLCQPAGPPASLAEVLGRASAAFRQRYGEAPTVCFVHPRTLPAGREGLPPSLRLLTTRAVKIGCYWLGASFDPAQAKEAITP